MNQPVMDHWTTVKRIHQSALDVDPSQRAALVDELCGGDEALRREVHSLLRYATDAESFLERPAADITTGPSSEPPRAATPFTVSYGRSVSTSHSTLPSIVE